MWRRIRADGCEWEVRAVTREGVSGTATGSDAGEVLEFRALDGVRPPRRIAADRELDEMDDAALLITFRQALPIGGDHYGRPGKRMDDV